ncbi:hypothetical protein [Mucilaginibacter agri]|uniref:Uncharacterized protein n=1 Tax=Mucilaginibacter agri TaxID=2695265 RepID=A0A965ZJ58_9SPHI|nr:hypothetical protein [Mucilaginibacter agri]NCD70651.1 hypothetical protein [Mucilaginibacter agri]
MNDEFDENLQCQFPNGFLHFQFILEFFFKDEFASDAHIDLINSALKWLWDRDLSVVASCDYEQLLLNQGGYKNQLLSWPNKEHLKAG